MTLDQNQEVCKCLANWYRQVSGGQYPLSQEHLDSIVTNRVELYSCRSHEGLRFPIMVTPAEVEEGIPGEEELAQAVRSLKRGRSGSPLVMRVEGLKEWLKGASRETNPVTHWWWLLVRLI